MSANGAESLDLGWRSGSRWTSVSVILTSQKARGVELGSKCTCKGLEKGNEWRAEVCPDGNRAVHTRPLCRDEWSHEMYLSES